MGGSDSCISVVWPNTSIVPCLSPLKSPPIGTMANVRNAGISDR